ncbi:MAG: ABC transporter ATP-binding protein [Chloroflexota bacterium]|nr:ABC transporter ATP-binding protein [Chloroflexota bacterium]
MQESGSELSTSSVEPILVAQDLHKTYGGRPALRSLSFSLRAGRVLGFLGPNGAGKTTAIRVLTTILEPTAGRFAVDGISSDDPERIRRKIGVLPEGLGFPKHITGLEYLAYFGQLFGRNKADATRVGLELLKEVGLQNRADSLIGTYSHGMRQRLGIARALVNDPRVVFLDEPTLGLDPRGQRELLAHIQRIARDRNAGVVLSSHLLAEIEGICDDVVIMNAGQVVAKGTVAEVIGQGGADGAGPNALRIRVPPDSAASARQALEAAPNVRRATVTDQAAAWLTVETADAGGDAPGRDGLGRNLILDSLIHANIPILAVEPAGGRLQDVFLQLTAEAIQ